MNGPELAHNADSPKAKAVDSIVLGWLQEYYPVDSRIDGYIELNSNGKEILSSLGWRTYHATAELNLDLKYKEID